MPCADLPTRSETWIHTWQLPSGAQAMNWIDPLPRMSNKRAAERRCVALPARLTWKDQRGATRFASVVTRDVSEYGVFLECQTAVSIPLFRLVQFQLERDVRDA